MAVDVIHTDNIYKIQGRYCQISHLIAKQEKKFSGSSLDRIAYSQRR